MAIIHSSDNHLRMQGFADKYTIVKYDNERCFFSRQLTTPFENLSNHPRYKDVKFLCIHSNENPVARIEVEMKRMPFLSIYTQGILIDCGCVRSENGILRFLEKLKKETEKRTQISLQTTTNY
ncbi:MAG: hypothetical protein M3R27_05195 [Bacteroidota bacterium]|nr:hypothetical protein [Bacteroidota bacterium]